MDAYLTVGGIPEYLKRINKYSSFKLEFVRKALKKIVTLVMKKIEFLLVVLLPMRIIRQSSTI